MWPIETAHLALTNSNNSENGVVVDADDYVADDDTEANDNDNEIEKKKKTVTLFSLLRNEFKKTD